MDSGRGGAGRGREGRGEEGREQDFDLSVGEDCSFVTTVDNYGIFVEIYLHECDRT